MNRERSGEIKTIGQSGGFDGSVLPELSVMLPTYNRSDALLRTLRALEEQTTETASYEIIVVDDGSMDNTPDLLLRFSERTGARFAYAVLKKNGGPARARNVGLSMVRSRAVLILGDDIEPAANLVEKHLTYHREYSDDRDALLGYVSFPKGLHPDGFMRWLEQDGRKYFFNYAELYSGEEAGPLFFYTCNVSVKMSLLEKSGWFDESFPYASHEDLELGYRLADQGMRLIYDSTAEGFHWHMLTVQGITRRVYLMGYSAMLFWSKVRQADGMVKRAARRILSLFCSAPWGVFFWNQLRNRRYPDTEASPVQWQLLLFFSFFIGLADAYRNREIRL
ncbi:MAG: glycosyltransferase family 2 protein [Candidatus Electrothrix sp. AR4]|nr:glycosyltransferase family 2 protein [Candidatus Electrothrix sp. AR4]